MLNAVHASSGPEAQLRSRTAVRNALNELDRLYSLGDENYADAGFASPAPEGGLPACYPASYDPK